MHACSTETLVAAGDSTCLNYTKPPDCYRTVRVPPFCYHPEAEVRLGGTTGRDITAVAGQVGQPAPSATTAQPYKFSLFLAAHGITN